MKETNIMYKIYKWFLVSVVVVLLSACGGGSDASGDTSSPNAQTIAIDKIKVYANDNTQAVPNIQDYKDAGVEGVTNDNINAVNSIVASLTESDVDTPEKIQILLTNNGLTLNDITPPVITLKGANPKTIIESEIYTEPGATAVDDRDGDVNVIITGDIDTSTIGTYIVTYNAEDAAGNQARKTRTVYVVASPLSNTAPTANAGSDKSVEVNNMITIIGSGSDSDGSVIAYEWKNGNAVISTNASFDYTPIAVGTDTLTLKVTDDDGSTDTDSMKVTVTAATPPPPPSGNPSWSFKGTVAQGEQFDAQPGPSNKIHIISSRYYQIDLSGHTLVDENQGDEQQGDLDFPPAIAVGDDGSVHIVTRGSGDIKKGVDIRYRRRNTSGVWDRNYLFGGKVERNYVVGIAWADNNNIIMCSTKKNSADVYGDIRLYQAGISSASSLGSLSGMWRADVDTRLRGTNSTVYLGAGKHNSSSSTVYFSQAATGPELRDRLNNNKKTHASGSPRRSFPDLALDGQNNTHFIYGAKSEVYYNKYDSNGNKVFGSDKRIFSSLGTWHLSIGLAAIAVSESGQTVVVVALRAKGDNQAVNSDLLWAYSKDGGSSWSSVQDTGKNSDAGEGKKRPRLIAVGDSFVLLYGETGVSGIRMGLLTFP